MPSDIQQLKRRTPRQARSEDRHASVLDAAAELIAEIGYDAATMTAIAERAGSSIGAVYQYFRNKEEIARALREQYAEEMAQRWARLEEEAARLTLEELVHRLFDLMIDFMAARPAYIPLLSAPLNYQRSADARMRLREHFARIFQQKKPGLRAERAYLIANVTLQLVKGLNPLYAQSKAADRKLLVQEFKAVVTAYLTLSLSD
ncbi:TetR/AcrR family transcriptional regulator [Undibacterium sp.]|jgi:AcrR family transcriptional regulator|uniref:TetR/AcrR family transcriptional regulator n=1 Tax=Undibacterium sp. TaxID=1914977 RepID=UPI002D144D35|nr:TetR/AcrR family transcriptional regulator [Undibacterium sp.]HTD06155.1 TetR/AcrR family transcriptional regulator [Undibacterium sp.]